MYTLFWSGGKDSYLALELFSQYHPEADITLLTSYNQETGSLPWQGVSVNDIKKQAAQLDYPLTTVPLPPEPSNEIYLGAIKEALDKQSEATGQTELIFGDWGNEQIREWREQVFRNQRNYVCHFPIWKKSLHELFPVLMFKPVRIYISYVAPKWHPFLRVGEEYTQQLVRMLPKEMDPMGENGEFHTRLEIQSLNEDVV